jgi:hypothetical protein
MQIPNSQCKNKQFNGLSNQIGKPKVCFNYDETKFSKTRNLPKKKAQG